MFPKLEITEENLLIGKNIARQLFVFTVTTRSNRKGLLPVIATYRFQDETIVHLNVAISVGWLSITDEDLAP